MRQRGDRVIPASRLKRSRRVRGRRRWLMRLAAFVVAPVIVLAVSEAGRMDLPSWLAGGRAECDIKGNISSTGERIYHVPGGAYYDATLVSLIKGERWFCSEAEARTAGWRKSRR